MLKEISFLSWVKFKTFLVAALRFRAVDVLFVGAGWKKKLHLEPQVCGKKESEVLIDYKKSRWIHRNVRLFYPPPPPWQVCLDYTRTRWLEPGKERSTWLFSLGKHGDWKALLVVTLVNSLNYIFIKGGRQKRPISRRGRPGTLRAHEWGLLMCKNVVLRLLRESKMGHEREESTTN